MKNSNYIFKRDMLISIENNDSAVAKLSVFEEIVTKPERGKIVFWNNNPGDGLYIVSACLYEKKTSVTLVPTYVKKIDIFQRLDAEIGDFRFVHEFYKTFSKINPKVFSTKQQKMVREQCRESMREKMSELLKDIDSMNVSSQVKDEILIKISSHIDQLNFLSVAEKISVLKPISERTSVFA